MKDRLYPCGLVLRQIDEHQAHTDAGSALVLSHCKYLLLFITFFVLGFLKVAAQETSPRNTAYSPQTETFVKKASQYYESLAHTLLSKYYNQNLFLIDAQIEIETPDQSGSLSPPDQLSESASNEDSPSRLPGLPVLPDGEGEIAQEALMRVRSVTLEVLIDTSYGKKAPAFIKNLLTMSTDINEMRGDRIQVNLAIFPSKTSNEAPQVLPYSTQNTQEDESWQKQERATDSLLMDPEMNKRNTVPALAAANPFQPFIENLASLIPLFIICLFLLLTTWLVIKSMAARRSQEEERYTLLLQQIKDLKQTTAIAALPAPTQAALPSSLETQGQNALASLSTGATTFNAGNQEESRNSLLSAFIGHPQRCAQVLRSWLTQNQGAQEAAALIKLIDPRLMGSLESEFPATTYTLLKKAFTAPVSEGIRPLEELSQQFIIAFNRLGQDELSTQDTRDLFGFLRQLNEQQLLHLLKDEAEGVIGIVLAQLDAEAASSLLQRFPSTRQASVLGLMGKVEHLSVKVYKEVADRLSHKALDVIHMRFVASDGVEAVQRLLDKLPVALQEDYLNNLAEVNLALAEKVRKTFVTLTEIPTLPDPFLGQFVRKVDQELLILCLLKADEPIKKKLFQVLPERMQALIHAGMEAHDQSRPEEIEKAQQQFLTRLREELRQLGGRPA